jgi:hypothetical protein
MAVRHHALARTDAAPMCCVRALQTTDQCLSGQHGLHIRQSLSRISRDRVEVNEVFGGLDYTHDLYHELSEKTVYIPSASL